MKRTISVFLLLALLLAGCGKKPETESPEPALETGVAAENAEDYTVINGELWILEDGEAKPVGNEARETNGADGPEETEEAPAPAEPETAAVPADFTPVFLASDGKNPVLCSADGRISWDGELVSLLPSGEEQGRTVTSFAVAGDTAVAAFAWEWQNGGNTITGDRLCFYNRATGDSIALDPLFRGPARVLPGGDEAVWIMNTDGATLFTFFYPYNVLSMQADLPIKTEGFAECAGWDGESGIFYCVERGGTAYTLHAWNPDSGEEEILPFAPEGWNGSRPVDLSFEGGWLIIRCEDGSLTVSAGYLPPEDDERTVTIVVTPSASPYGRSGSESAAGTLLRLGAEIGLNVRIRKLSSEKIAVKLLAGDADFDLFPTDGTQFSESKPFWEPLEGYDVLMEQAEKLLPDGLRLCSRGGHVFGVPYSGNPGFTWRVATPAAAERMGLDEEEMVSLGMTDGTWTLADYYALALRAKEAGCAIGRGMLLPLSEWGARYMKAADAGGGVGVLTDPDGKALREYLETFKKLRDGDLFWNGDLTKLESADDLLLNYYFPQDADDDVIRSGRTLVFAPSFDGERSYSVQMSFYMMNKNAPHKEAAARVLGLLLDPDNGIFYTNSENFYLYRQDEELMETDGAKRNWEVYLDAMRYFTLRPAYVGDWISFADAEQEKYLNDEQDLDYTVRRILDRAKMVMEG